MNSSRACAIAIAAILALSTAAARAAEYNPYVTVDHVESVGPSTRGTGHDPGLGDLPAPPRMAAGQAPRPKAPGRGTYSNSFACIPDSVPGRTARGTPAYNPETLTRTLSPRHGDGSVKTMLKRK